MTEAEARTKWCPYAASRSIDVLVGTGEKRNIRFVVGPEKETTLFCVGSLCMAWRWSSPSFANAQPGETGVAAGDGCCGLAGAP